MSESILNSVKKVLGITEDYTDFDVDITMHINSVFSTLTQLGIGPVDGFLVEDDGEEWDEFIGEDLNLSPVKTYTCLRVRMAFDPPGTSFHINAMQEQIKELEWRLNSYREVATWPSL